MKTSSAEFKSFARDMAKHGIKVRITRQGEGIVVKRHVPDSRRRAAFDAILRRLKKARPAKPGGFTASALVRQMRDSGRY
jgi:hypothetical protein